MATWTFKTPTISEGPLGNERLFQRFKMEKGISIVNLGGVYSQVRTLDANQFSTYTAYYTGGGTFTVTDAVRTAMLAANVGITSANFTLQ